MTPALLNYSEFSLSLAIIAITYAVILVEPKMILVPFYKVIERFIGRYPYLFKMVIDCERCVSGQFALWLFLYYHHDLYKVSIVTALLTHIFVISQTILFTSLINSIYQWTKNKLG